METQQQRMSYFNTLIFTIIAGIISLILLVLMFFKIFEKVIPMIITIEIGIFIIIIVCIYQIVSGQKKIDAIVNQKDFIINFDVCPDYYMEKVQTDGTTVCSNEYTTMDEFGNRFIIKLLPDSGTETQAYSFPPVHTDTYTPTTSYATFKSTDMDKFENTFLTKNTDFKDNQAKCAAVLGTDDKFENYNKMPVMGLMARCESYSK